jgi:hypothetical protein
MFTYDLIQEYGYKPGDTVDVISTRPYWVLCVVRLAYPTTYDRATQQSFTNNFTKAVQTRGKPLIITGDCLGMEITSTKNTHLTKLTASIKANPNINYQFEIFPDDYVFGWMVNSREAALTIIERIQSSKHCNRFGDGLKFLGRVASLNKQLTEDAGGTKRVRYSLTGLGFTELDASIYYNPYLAMKTQDIGQYFYRLGAQINNLIDVSKEGIPTHKAIPTFLDLFLGTGLPPNFGREGPEDPRTNSTAGTEGEYAAILPEIIGTFLHKTNKSKPSGILAWADLLELVYGVQQYGSAVNTQDYEQEQNLYEVSADQLTAARSFCPDNTQKSSNRRFTGGEMQGLFLPYPPQFSNQSVWNVLNQYLNPTINEMYTCMRANADGLVVPTMVVRQIPFSTQNPNLEIPVTRFLDMPRWVMHPAMVNQYSITRSNALKYNFIQVMGDPGPVKYQGFDYTYQIVYNPPVRDDLDISRSFLHPYMMNINCHPRDIINKNPRQWMDVISDYLMGQHLTLTGALECKGISAPICPGDNLEFDNAVYHIESVTHKCGCDAQGRATFRTTLTLTNGVNKNPGDFNIGVYAGVSADAFRTYEPGLTTDNPDPITTEPAPILSPNTEYPSHVINESEEPNGNIV